MPPVVAFIDYSPATLLILGALAVLLFGERLPEVARTVGNKLMDFKKEFRAVQQESQNAVNSSEASKPAIGSRYEEPEDRQEATAPKFEPPASLP